MRRTAVLICCLNLAAFGQEAAPRPTFEVASVKTAQQSSAAMMGGGVAAKRMLEMMQNVMPGGVLRVEGRRVTLRNQSLLTLIAAAYRVKTTQVSAPSWLSDTNFDIDAKIADDESTARANEMLQTLLEQRFGLKAHREGREVSGFNLMVGKNGPKLKASTHEDPSDSRSAKERVEAAMPSPKAEMDMVRKQAEAGGGMNRTTAKGITMEQLATMVARSADAPVVDMTELTGKYDVVLETAPDRPDQPGRSIFEAVEALGLKLIPRKVAVDTIVVDQLSKTPTGN